jgi:hypothetical protein
MSLFRRAPKNLNRQIVDAAYSAVIEAARQPVIYRDWGVPDTPLGPLREHRPAHDPVSLSHARRGQARR